MKPDFQKTVVVQLGLNVLDADLERVFSEIGPLKRCYILKSKSNNKPNTGFATFTTHDDAINAINTIKSINNERVEVKFSERKPAVSGNQETLKLAKCKKFRLIIRNLPYEVKTEEIKDTFKAFGNLIEIKMPLGESKNVNKGFAFLQFTTQEEALNAIKLANATKIKGRQIAIDWAIPKVKYDTQTNQLKIGTIDQKECKLYDNVLSSLDDGVKETGKKDELNSATTIKPKKKSPDIISLKEAKQFNHKKTDEMNLHDVDENKTLFVRNIPLDCDSSDLRPIFQKYGIIEYIKLNSFIGEKQHKGMGFVKFANQNDAKACLESYMNLKTAQPKVDNSLFGSGGLRDLNSNSFEIEGQMLNICVAVNKEKLEGIIKDRKRKFASLLHDEPVEIEHGNNKFKTLDKRNLHLLKEGSLKKCQNQYGPLPQVDIVKRTKLMTASKRKLKLLHYFVSPTRLTVHNLPKNVDKIQLRKIFFDACKDPTAKINEARIMVNKQELNGQGVHPSLGFGFVEFGKHAHALAALRAVDNNPNILPPDPRHKETRRPIVQFAVENMLALKLKKARQEKAVITQKKQKGFVLEQYPTNVNKTNKDKESKPPTQKPLDTRVSKASKNQGSSSKVSKTIDEQPKAKTKKLKEVITEKAKLNNCDQELDEIEEARLVKNARKVHAKLFAEVGSQFLDSGDDENV